MLSEDWWGILGPLETANLKFFLSLNAVLVLLSSWAEIYRVRALKYVKCSALSLYERVEYLWLSNAGLIPTDYFVMVHDC